MLLTYLLTSLIVHSYGFVATFTQYAPEMIKFGKKNNVKQRSFRRSRSFKVTDFGANRKLIYNFLLVINTNLPLILSYLIGCQSKIVNMYNGAIFCTNQSSCCRAMTVF